MSIPAHALMNEIRLSHLNSLISSSGHTKCVFDGHKPNSIYICKCVILHATCRPQMTSCFLWRDIALMHPFAHLKGSTSIIHKSLKPYERFISEVCLCIVS